MWKTVKNYLLKIQNLHYSVGKCKHNLIEQNLRTCISHEAGEGQLPILTVPGNHHSAFCFSKFGNLGMLCKWNHEIFVSL